MDNLNTRITVYTDGACKGNPGPGGWGVLLQHGENEKVLCGGEAKTTNNRMELMAVIEAFKAIKRPCEIDWYLDSQYVRQGITEWMAGWKQKKWRTANGKPVKNQDLWQTLDRVMMENTHRINWHWVKGHSGNEGNDRADALANQGIEKINGNDGN